MNQELEKKIFKTRRRCPICGKPISPFISADYGWKLDKKIFCSYTCMRVVEKQREEAEKKKIEKQSKKY